MDSTGWSAYVVGRIGWETLPAKATAGTDCSREYRSPSPGPELRKRLRRFATCSPPTPARGCSGSAPGGRCAARGSLAVPVDDEQQRAQREQQPEGEQGGERGERSGERPGAYGDHQDAQSVAHAGPPRGSRQAKAKNGSASSEGTVASHRAPVTATSPEMSTGDLRRSHTQVSPARGRVTATPAGTSSTGAGR